MFCGCCLRSSCQRFGPWFYLTLPHLAKPTLEFLSTVDWLMLRIRGTTSPFSRLVSATQRVIESLSGGLLRWGSVGREGRKYDGMVGVSWLSHLVTAVFYGFLFLCDFLLPCHIGFQAIGYRVKAQLKDWRPPEKVLNHPTTWRQS